MLKALVNTDDDVDSNTTLVKVKCGKSNTVNIIVESFKYNSC